MDSVATGGFRSYSTLFLQRFLLLLRSLPRERHRGRWCRRTDRHLTFPLHQHVRQVAEEHQVADYQELVQRRVLSRRRRGPHDGRDDVRQLALERGHVRYVVHVQKRGHAQRGGEVHRILVLFRVCIFGVLARAERVARVSRTGGFFAPRGP